MGNYHKAYSNERECQYLGDDLLYEYFISNNGNFASYEGANYEAYFEPAILNGEKAFVENEAPNSGEYFVWFSMTDYLSELNGQKVFTVSKMIELVKDYPLISFLYVYDLASGADAFSVSDEGLHFVDAVGEDVLLTKDSDFVFYIDGLSIKVKE
jgi:hypothetical protein